MAATSLLVTSAVAHAGGRSVLVSPGAGAHAGGGRSFPALATEACSFHLLSLHAPNSVQVLAPVRGQRPRTASGHIPVSSSHSSSFFACAATGSTVAAVAAGSSEGGAETRSSLSAGVEGAAVPNSSVSAVIADAALTTSDAAAAAADEEAVTTDPTIAPPGNKSDAATNPIPAAAVNEVAAVADPIAAAAADSTGAAAAESPLPDQHDKAGNGSVTAQSRPAAAAGVAGAATVTSDTSKIGNKKNSESSSSSTTSSSKNSTIYRRSSTASTTTTTSSSMSDGGKGSEGAEVVNPGRIAKRAKDWERARDVLAKGKIFKTRVEACNEGGARVRFGSLVGFLPFSQALPRDIPPGASRAEVLLGKELTVMVTEVEEGRNRLIVSERQAAKKVKLEKLRQGMVLEGVVSSITDFGAFVDLNLPDGKPMGVGGLVHLSELSWDPVLSVAATVTVGQAVLVKVLSVDRKRTRLSLSMKQAESDPLNSTMDALLHSSAATSATLQASGSGRAGDMGGLLSQPIAEELLGAPLPGLAALCQELRKQEGVLEVNLGRQALERRVVSQDLELWLSSAPETSGQYALVARAGRQVQEVFVKTALDREAMKNVVLRVTASL